ncbi:hypothetical protein HYU21_00840 [Candidatus Woesearchaeota archaeon]|nr:hypothetical protein [Candidatus Woesearchaeota archaeon]
MLNRNKDLMKDLMKNNRTSILLSIIITLFFILATENTVAEKEVLEIDFLISTENTVALDNLRVFYDEPDAEEIENEDYSLLIYNQQRAVLQNQTLPVYFYLFDSPQLPNEVPLTIKIPYHQNYKYLELQKNKTTFFFKDIGILCQKNKRCEASENYASCPQDCPSGGSDGFCDTLADGRCDPDCLANDLDCLSKEEGTSLWWVIIFLILIMIILYYLKKTNNFSRLMELFNTKKKK